MLAPGERVHLVLRPVQYLLAVVAGVQPRVRLPRVADQGVSPAERLRQVDRVIYYGEVSDLVAVPDEMLHHGSFVALRNAIGADPPALEMRGVYRQDVAFVFPRGESGPSVLRVGR